MVSLLQSLFALTKKRSRNCRTEHSVCWLLLSSVQTNPQSDCGETSTEIMWRMCAVANDLVFNITAYLRAYACEKADFNQYKSKILEHIITINKDFVSLLPTITWHTLDKKSWESIIMCLIPDL